MAVKRFVHVRANRFLFFAPLFFFRPSVTKPALLPLSWVKPVSAPCNERRDTMDEQQLQAAFFRRGRGRALRCHRPLRAAPAALLPPYSLRLPRGPGRRAGRLFQGLALPGTAQGRAASALLYRLAYTACIDQIRRRKRQLFAPLPRLSPTRTTSARTCAGPSSSSGRRSGPWSSAGLWRGNPSKSWPSGTACPPPPRGSATSGPERSWPGPWPRLTRPVQRRIAYEPNP